MKRCELEDIVDQLDSLRDRVKFSEYSFGTPIDIYELAKDIEKVSLMVVEADDHLGDIIEDAEDEARSAMFYQEEYLDQLHEKEDELREVMEELEDYKDAAYQMGKIRAIIRGDTA